VFDWYEKTTNKNIIAMMVGIQLHLPDYAIGPPDYGQFHWNLQFVDIGQGHQNLVTIAEFW
jgi:hypothetical protein